MPITWLLEADAGTCTRKFMVANPANATLHSGTFSFFGCSFPEYPIFLVALSLRSAAHLCCSSSPVRAGLVSGWTLTPVRLPGSASLECPLKNGILTAVHAARDVC